MPSFEEMFLASRGQPIQYNKNTLVLLDFFPPKGVARLRLEFETADGSWRQGVFFRFVHRGKGATWARGASDRVQGSLLINGERLDGRDGVVLWQDTAPRVVEFEVIGSPQAISVKNVWDSGNGSMDSGHNGAAMVVEELASGRRYHCNDGRPDDDFDDLVFRLERVQ